MRARREPQRRPRARDELADDHHRDAARAPAARRHRRADRASRSRAARRAARTSLSLAARDARRGGRGAGLRSAATTWRRSRDSSRWTPAALARQGDRARARAAGAAHRPRRLRAAAQFHILLLSSLYGVCLLLSADSFLTLFLGLELMSLPVYVLVLLAYRRPESAEAALKYLVLGGTATATLLMGVVAAVRRQRLAGARRVRGRAAAPTTRWPRVAVVLVVVAFFLKAAIVPFHAWAPDAYEGAARPGDRVHGDDRQGRRAARRRAPVRRRAAVAADGRPGRAAAARRRSSGATWRRCGSRASAG